MTTVQLLCCLLCLAERGCETTLVLPCIRLHTVPSTSCTVHDGDHGLQGYSVYICVIVVVTTTMRVAMIAVATVIVLLAIWFSTAQKKQSAVPAGTTVAATRLCHGSGAMVISTA